LEEQMIEAILERCAGIDVGKKFVVVCVMTGGAKDEPHTQIKKFGTVVAATNRKGSQLQSRYHALRARCGNKRAIVALGHMLLKMVHAVSSARLPYREDPLAPESRRNEERAPAPYSLSQEARLQHILG